MNFEKGSFSNKLYFSFWYGITKAARKAASGFSDLEKINKAGYAHVGIHLWRRGAEEGVG
jgi:hypothetical protein